jgi:TetR/AcrR family transcriptional repressor of nem operon
MTESTDRRSGIVRAAFRLVASAGFEGLRLQQIAKDVGIDHSTLYHHFPGKSDIVAALASYAISRFEVTPPEGAGPAETLRAQLAHLRALMTDSPDVFVVTAELDLRARRDPAVRAVLERHEANWRRWLRELLAAGDAQDLWSSRVDVDGAVELVIAVVKGVQLAPEAATPAFAQLDALLTRGTERMSDGG